MPIPSKQFSHGVSTWTPGGQPEEFGRRGGPRVEIDEVRELRFPTSLALRLRDVGAGMDAQDIGLGMGRPYEQQVYVEGPESKIQLMEEILQLSVDGLPIQSFQLV